MADGDVEVTLSYPWQDHDIGDKIRLEATEAKRLVRAGVAVYATAAAAKAAGDPDATTATRRSRG